MIYSEYEAENVMNTEDRKLKNKELWMVFLRKTYLNYSLFILQSSVFIFT